MEKIALMITEWIFLYGTKLVIGSAILVAGWLLIDVFTGMIKRRFRKREMDPSLQSFILSLTKVALRVLLIITVAGMIGIQTASFIAVLGAASLAIGFALQGTLQNFAGGVIILTVKPFVTGDFIQVNGESGTVEKINIFYTYLKTPDNKVVLLPNGAISNSVLTNFTREEKRRVDLSIGISYGDDVKLARAVILEIISEDDRILKDPAPVVFLGELGDNSVDLTIRCWAGIQDYWPVFFSLQEKIYEVFPEKGLSFPFPQLDVHMIAD
jgi:small conductance mechanosensitive channel